MWCMVIKDAHAISLLYCLTLFFSRNFHYVHPIISCKYWCKLEQLLPFFSFFENSLQWCLFFFICSSLLVRLLCNFWYLKELCISCSLLTMMALHRIFTISMFERSYWWAYLLLAVHLTSSGSMAAKMGNASNISTTLWSSSTMPWDTCPASSSASTQTQWSVIVILSRGLWTY